MKLLVPIKMVPNPTLPVRMSRDTATPQKPDLKDIPLVINPFDENALEEAVLLREAQIASNVTVISVGPDSWVSEMRTALALGADKAVHIPCDKQVSPLTIAKCIKQFIALEDIQLILCGRQGVDADNGSVGPMLAALLGWGQATFVSKLSVNGNLATVKREVDGGTQELTLPLPAVITTDLSLNTPRYASLPNIMLAKRKPLETLSAQKLGVELTHELEIIKYQTPPPRPPTTRLNSVAELESILSKKGFLS
ncbi:MAG: electron transfer flavoprotein subunit beta/FixA family protein [Magnetococcales bacterium]|nr:electron transfer flavoprotein subunit beta/FixA family protein [Magnetococcales bacterium]